MARYCGFSEEAMDSVLITLDKMDKIGFEGVEKELLENGNAKESVDRYLELLRTVTRDAEGVKALGETLKDVMDPAVCQGLVHIMETVKDVAEMSLDLYLIPLWFVVCPTTQALFLKYPWKASAVLWQAADATIR